MFGLIQFTSAPSRNVRHKISVVQFESDVVKTTVRVDYIFVYYVFKSINKSVAENNFTYLVFNIFI